MYTFKALQGTARHYLEDLVVPYQPTRSLRAESGSFLAVSTTRGVTYGNRCFRKAVGTLWNNLPVTTRKKITNIMYLAGKKYIFLNM